MGKRTAYAPGTFSWIELSTTDVAGAKAFYGALFGWDFKEDEIPEGGVYVMVRKDGDEVAGMMRQDGQQAAAGIPPHWLSYVTVASADEAAARADELGGITLAEPFDVLDAGRMAVVADPTGASLALWEPRAHAGAGRVNEPGALTWNELATGDLPAAIRFYQDLFGWRVEEIDTGGGPRYWSIGHDGGAGGLNGGMRELPSQPQAGAVPPHWLPYFAVESVADAITRAQQLGGQVVMPETQTSTGTFAVLGDPQGAVVAVFAGNFDD